METGFDQTINLARHQKINWTIAGLVGAAILILGALFGSAATSNGWFWGNGGGENRVPIYVSADSKVNEQVTLNGGFSPIAKAVTPAVVTINVQSRARQSQVPFFMDPCRRSFDNTNRKEGLANDESQTARRRQGFCRAIALWTRLTGKG